MKLNSSECKVIHFGNKNLRSEYSIDDLTTEQRIKLDVSECERDFGVLVSSDLKWSKHVANIEFAQIYFHLNCFFLIFFYVSIYP